MKKTVKKLFKSAGYNIEKIDPLTLRQLDNPIRFKNFLDRYFSRIDSKNFFFVQIGAHNGKLRDPLYPYVTKYNLSGLTIEPQLHVFKELEANYKDHGGLYV